MGSWGHTIQIKALPERKRSTQKNFEWLLGSTMTAFSVFTLRDSISRRYYRRISALSEVVDWSFDSGEYKDTRSITVQARVSSHAKYSAVDHWLELFKARLTNEAEADINAMRLYIAKKQFEVMPSDLNYRDMLQATAKYNQLILLERGLYLLQKDGPYILPLEPSPGQPQEHFEPTDAPYDAPIPLDFFKPGEQARINAYLESDYCLCEVCQSERARLGII